MKKSGNKEVMASNLRHLLSYHNKLQKEVCSDLNIKETTFSDWITAKSYPRIDKIELLATYFGVKKSALIEAPAENEDIVVSNESDGTLFSFKICDSSMHPLIIEKDIVIVQPCNAFHSGDIALVTFNDSETSCRKVITQPSGISLVPLNTDFEPHFFSHEELMNDAVRFDGKVIELRRKL